MRITKMLRLVWYDIITHLYIYFNYWLIINSSPPPSSTSAALCGSDGNNMAPGGTLASGPVVVWETGDPAGWTSAPSTSGKFTAERSVRRSVAQERSEPDVLTRQEACLAQLLVCQELAAPGTTPLANVSC